MSKAMQLLRMVGFLACTIFFVPYSAAEERIGSFLYRVDTRAPDEVFRDGFSSFGSNDNIVAHARGRTCNGGNQSSAFISTTADFSYAENYARRLTTLTENNTAYIYTIRPTSTIYQMSRALRAAGASGESSISTAEAQSEWVAFMNIPGNTISGARQYTNTNPNGVASANANYVPGPIVISTTAYTPTSGTPVEETQPRLFTSLTPLVGLCMSALGGCSGRQPRSTGSTSTCTSRSQERVVTREAIYQLLGFTSVVVN